MFMLWIYLRAIGDEKDYKWPKIFGSLLSTNSDHVMIHLGSYSCSICTGTYLHTPMQSVA